MLRTFVSIIFLISATSQLCVHADINQDASAKRVDTDASFFSFEITPERLEFAFDACQQSLSLDDSSLTANAGDGDCLRILKSVAKGTSQTTIAGPSSVRSLGGKACSVVGEIGRDCD